MHRSSHPVLVTIRAGRRIPSLRCELVYNVLKDVVQRQSRRAYQPDFQVVHFSIQDDHLHLMVEANGDFLRKGVSGLLISFARRLNKKLGRRGKVWGDRHHRVDLATRAAVRRALSYVFQNWKKHGALVHGHELLDPYSSAHRFDGWSGPHVTFDETEPWPDVRPRTFLLAKGWKQAGGPLDTFVHPTPRPTKHSARLGLGPIGGPLPLRLHRWRLVGPSAD